MVYNDYLAHYGIPKMRWGFRRYQNKDGSLTALGKKRLQQLQEADRKSEPKAPTKSKSIKDMTDEELADKISRLKMEQTLKELMKEPTNGKPNAKSKGKEFVMDVLDKSGRNIATQAVTYGMGKLVNKALGGIAGEEVVNPKKGQKDK